MSINNYIPNGLKQEKKHPDFELYGRLMFITHRTAQYTEYDEVKMALEGGCSWIQLRMKDNLNLDTAKSVSALCREYTEREIILCIDDDIQIALNCGATSLHLGKNDMPISAAWDISDEQISPDNKFYIGATANTMDDIRQAIEEHASYIGLGPYRFTGTKKNLSPILGLEGYRKIIKEVREQGWNIPIFAIGGICLEDVGPLMETGITGIAVSGAIINAPDPIEETRKFIEEINKY